MRAVTVFAIVALAVMAACEGSRTGPMDPFAIEHAKHRAEAVEAMAAYLKDIKAPHKGMMRGQQATADPLCTTPEATNVISSGFALCATAGAILSSNFTSLAAANTGIGQFCSGECGSFLLKTDVKFLSCLPADASGFFSLAKFMCSKNGDTFCGAPLFALATLAPPCESKTTSPTCGATTGCTWDSTKNKCNIFVTAAQLEATCSPCLASFVKTFPTGGSLGASAALGIGQLQATLCAKHNKEFCYPKVQDTLNGGLETMTTAVLDNFCVDPTKMICLGKIMQAGLSFAKPQVDKGFMQCVLAVQNQTSLVDSRCKPIVQQYYASANQAQQTLGSLCLKNPAGQYCFASTADATQNAQIDACMGMAVGMGTCNATCDTVIKAVVDAQGCCLGTMHQLIFASSGTPASAYPKYTAVGSAPAATPRPTSIGDKLGLPAGTPGTPGTGEKLIENPPSGGLEALGACASLKDTIKSKLTIGCAKPTVKKVKKAIKVRLAYNRIANDAALKAKMIAAMTNDAAAAAGVSPAEISNQDIVEDTSVTVTTATRRMLTLATASGSKFTFDMEGQTDAMTEAASSAFDTQAAAGTLSLASTQAVVSSDCTDCTSSSEGLVAGTESSSTSGSAAFTAVAAVATAVLALLL